MYINTDLYIFSILCRVESLGSSRFSSFNIVELPSIIINDLIIKSLSGETGFISVIWFNYLSHFIGLESNYFLFSYNHNSMPNILQI